mmetsp:Transcript_94184/g.272147  ORF Transcript_94184/g.272147 Transcript_94184/m.272147 type:complete len:456 (+) Transcript_94184:305-1672(+)
MNVMHLRDSGLPIPQCLLFIGNLHDDLLLFQGAILRRLLLFLGFIARPSLVSLPEHLHGFLFPVLHDLQSLGRGLFALTLALNVCLLVLDDQLLGAGLELGGRLPYNDHGDLLELRHPELLDHALPRGRQKVALQFGHHEVAVCSGCKVGQQSTYHGVVHTGHAELHVRLVHRVRGGLRAGQAAPRAPLEELAIAELDVVGMPLEEGVHPVEVALLRQAHRDNHLEDTVARLRLLHDVDVGGGGVGDHGAGEGELGHGRRAEVHLQRHVPEGNRGEKRLAQQGLRDGLRVARSGAVREEAHGVRVRARSVEVHQQAQDDLPAVLRTNLPPRRRRDVVALAIEASALAVRLAQEQRRGGAGEAQSAKLPLRQGAGRLWAEERLHDPDLEQVPAGLDAGRAPRARNEVLPAAVGQRHHHGGVSGAHHVHRRVARVDGHGAWGDLRASVRRSILLGLN